MSIHTPYQVWHAESGFGGSITAIASVGGSNFTMIGSSPSSNPDSAEFEVFDYNLQIVSAGVGLPVGFTLTLPEYQHEPVSPSGRSHVQLLGPSRARSAVHFFGDAYVFGQSIIGGAGAEQLGIEWHKWFVPMARTTVISVGIGLSAGFSFGIAKFSNPAPAPRTRVRIDAETGEEIGGERRRYRNLRKGHKSMGGKSSAKSPHYKPTLGSIPKKTSFKPKY